MFRIKNIGLESVLTEFSGQHFLMMNRLLNESSTESPSLAVMKIPLFSFFCLVFLQVLVFPGLARESKVRSSPAPIGYSLTPMALGRVALGYGFWGDRMKIHVKVTIPHVLKTLGVDYSDRRPGRSPLALVRTLEGVSYSLLYKDQK